MPRPGEQATDNADLTDLRRRLARLESQGVRDRPRRSSDHAQMHDGGENSPRQPSLPVEEDKPPAEYLADAEAEFRAQPKNQAWATAAETAYLTELGASGTAAGFEVLRVDCRTTHCFAEVEWPNYETALNKIGSILHGEFSHNCNRGVFTLPPAAASASARYRHKVLFDCTEPLPSGVAKK